MYHADFCNISKFLIFNPCTNWFQISPQKTKWECWPSFLICFSVLMGPPPYWGPPWDQFWIRFSSAPIALYPTPSPTTNTIPRWVEISTKHPSVIPLPFRKRALQFSKVKALTFHHKPNSKKKKKTHCLKRNAYILDSNSLDLHHIKAHHVTNSRLGFQQLC